MELLVETSAGSEVRPFVTKRGESVLISTLDDEACERLVDACLAYRPRDCFQGLPPLNDEVCASWVRRLLHEGVNFVAESKTNDVVGHAAIVPPGDRCWEMHVVVWPASIAMYR